MTIIVPSTNILSQLKKIQSSLFEKYGMVPTPFPKLITSISKTEPNRPTRKWIFEHYPETIHLNGFDKNEKFLNMKTSEPIPFIIDNDLKQLNIESNKGFYLNSGSLSVDLNQLPQYKTLQFSNYQLACYIIDSDFKDEFLINMHWEKLWEVKKGKTKI